MRVDILPAFPHRKFTEDEAKKLARMVEEAEKKFTEQK